MRPIFAQLLKVDESRQIIIARAATEELDKSGEIFDYASSKPLFAKWSSEIFADTGGRSLGNVRAMHSPVAAGKLTRIDFNDMEKSIDVELKVVDKDEWNKVLEGVYTGLSIGGRYVKRWTAVEKGREVTRYTAAPSEISLVDRPCMPSSRFFDVLKRDGTIDHVEFRKINKPRIVSSGDKHKVVDTDGHVYGTHPSRKKAVAQLRALYANKVEEIVNMLTKDFVQSPSATAGITSYRTGNPKKKKTANKADGDAGEEEATAASIGRQPSDAKGAARAKRSDPDPPPEVLSGENPDHHVSTGPEGSTSATKRDFSAAERKASAARGHAMPGGGYPIENTSDLHNAIQAFGRAKDKGKTKAHIKAQAKRLGATAQLPEEWGGAKKADGGYTLDELLEKGVSSVSFLAGICSQLSDWARSYQIEQEIEGDDDSEIAGKVCDKVAELLDLLAECAEEEAAELRDGETMDVLLMADQAQDLLKRIEVVRKRGARHSKADKALVNKLHDTAVELGADCGAAKVKPVGKTEKETTMKVTKGTPDVIAAAVTKAVLATLSKGGIEAEGPKRGSQIGEETDSEHSDNEERDPEMGTLDGSAGEDDPHSKPTAREKGGTKRGVGKADIAAITKAVIDAVTKAAADDGDGEDGEDGEEEEPPPKKGKKGAAKADEDSMTKVELVELVASTVTGTLQALGVIEKVDKTGDVEADAVGKIARRARPALFSVEKADDGRVVKSDGTRTDPDADPLTVALNKSLGARKLTPILKNDGTVDQPSSLIKHILSSAPMKRVTAESLSEVK